MNKLQLFVVWLEGYMEACGQKLNEQQTAVVKAKLDTIFVHEAEPVENVSLQELGEQHGFTVYDGFPNMTNLGRDESDGVLYRC